jgi:hypothetical protein
LQWTRNISWSGQSDSKSFCGNAKPGQDLHCMFYVSFVDNTVNVAEEIYGLRKPRLFFFRFVEFLLLWCNILKLAYALPSATAKFISFGSCGPWSGVKIQDFKNKSQNACRYFKILHFDLCF